MFTNFRVSALFFVLLAAYIYGFLFIPFDTKGSNSTQRTTISDLWFNPQWTTDDAYQQSFQFHKVMEPELFKDDLITEMMTHYLTPVHYWLSYGITYFTKSPILTGHWVMLIQILLTLGFLAVAVKKYTNSWAPAFFSVIWFVHSRPVLQRLGCGLPRGWAGPVLTAFLYFLSIRSHKGILATLFLGSITHPVSTFLCALTYGAWILFKSFYGDEIKLYRKNIISLLLFSPLLLAVTIYATKPDEKFGEMATLKKAATMPEFQKNGGRFPFVPLEDPAEEILTNGFQAFYYRFHRPMSPSLKTITPIFVVLILLFGILYKINKNSLNDNSVVKKASLLPFELTIFGILALFVYFLSRLLAFRLYVPDRHLQIPFCLFFVVSITIIFWKFFTNIKTGCGNENKNQNYLMGTFGLTLLGFFIFLNSGTGYYGSLNFNSHIYKKGRFNEWLSKNTPIDAVIAGHPVIVDATQLLGKRKVYISTETAHPFFDKYYETIKPRYELSLRAHYAKDLNELYELCKGKGIDYFVFWRKQFLPEYLKNAKAFKPFDVLVKQLASRDPANFAFRKLPEKASNDSFSPLVYKDSETVIVDLKLLEGFLSNAKLN